MRMVFAALVLVSVLVCAWAVSQTLAADAPTTVTGVLIDQACGGKMMAKDDPEKAAAAHPRSCAMKEACANSGYAVISGKHMLKFDENGNKLAKDYLAKSTQANDLRVNVHGTQKGDEIHVTSITAAPAK